MTVAYLTLGLALLIAGAELLVRGASRLASLLGISPLAIGLTVVAFGTSAPELAVSLDAANTGSADICLGNVIGSNIFNILVILGLSAVMTPLTVSMRIIRVETPLMIVSVLVLWAMGRDGLVGTTEGLILVSGFVVYTVWLIRANRLNSVKVTQESGQCRFHRDCLLNPLLMTAGLALLVQGARLLVTGAVRLAGMAGVSQLVIGITIVAAGTSLPEAATSVVAALRGERDIAVGNVVGSNLFNVMTVLGLSAALTGGGIPVGGQALGFDIPVMFAVSAACLPIFFTGRAIDRLEGLMMVLLYVIYTTVIIITGGDRAQDLSSGRVLIFVIAPLTATVLILSLRGARTSQTGGRMGNGIHNH